MPKIMTGTVIRWKEEEDQKKEAKKKTDVERGMYKPITFVSFQNIGVYVEDDEESSVVTARIIREYIQRNKDGEKPEKLWELYGQGLLQVCDVEQTAEVTPPHIPWDDK